MLKQAILAVAVSLSAAEAALGVTDLMLWIDVDGTAYLHNTTANPLSFEGYQIVSEYDRLDPTGWKSISDQAAANPLATVSSLGSGALLFDEANPSAHSLAELTVNGAATLAGGAKFSLGKPFLDSWPLPGVNAFYKAPGDPNSHNMEGAFPEPSTWLLAVLAALGLAVGRHRAGRSSGPPNG